MIVGRTPPFTADQQRHDGRPRDTSFNFAPNWADDYDEGSFEATFAEIYQEAFDILVERQKKYGPNNIEKLGLFGVFSRFADDKVERIRRAFNGIIQNGEVVLALGSDDFPDESVEDALFDSANYPLIMTAMRRGKWGQPLQDDLRAAKQRVLDGQK